MVSGAGEQMEEVGAAHSRWENLPQNPCLEPTLPMNRTHLQAKEAKYGHQPY
jgi:hypothetical protein